MEHQVSKTPQIETEVKKPFFKIDYGNDFMEIIEKEMIKKKNIVKSVCELNEQATNSDFILFLECLRYEFKEVKCRDLGDDILLKIPKSVIKRISSPDSYGRARRSLNCKGLCLPTNENVLSRRKNKEITMRKYFGMINEKEE